MQKKYMIPLKKKSNCSFWSK